MRRVLRFVASANAFYQGLVGLIGIFSPALLAALFHIGVPEPSEAGVIRLLSAVLCGNALLFVVLAQQKEGAMTLARWALASNIINLVANVAACVSRDLSWGTLVVAMFGQVAFVVTLLIWIRTPGILDAAIVEPAWKLSSSGIMRPPS